MFPHGTGRHPAEGPAKGRERSLTAFAGGLREFYRGLPSIPLATASRSWVR